MTKPDYIAIGFEQIDRDLRELMSAFAEVLRDLGHEDLANHLPWTGVPLDDDAGAELPPRLGLA